MKKGQIRIKYGPTHKLPPANWLGEPPRLPKHHEMPADANGAIAFARMTYVIQFCHKHSIVLPRKEYWYQVLDQRFGACQGLPNSHGTPCITNGIEVYIEKQDGGLYLGHIGSFVYDKAIRRPAGVGRAVDASKPIVILED